MQNIWMKSLTKSFIIKIDVDTERGTQMGVPRMVSLFKELNIPATFLFALGPDNTGRALKRIFRPGFLKKVSRTSVVSTYGLRTLLNGILWPGPHIGRKHSQLIRSVYEDGFDVGIHCYDHIKWQDGVTKMSADAILTEFKKATKEFKSIFGFDAPGAGAPGWQANEKTLAAYDEEKLIYGSDCRGTIPFIPKVGDKIFKTLQIPTTLPTLDELLGRPEYPLEKLKAYYISLLSNEHPNVMTVHAEIEGMKYYDWFKSFLIELKKLNLEFTTLLDLAKKTITQPASIPTLEVIQDTINGRSGKLAIACFKL